MAPQVDVKYNKLFINNEWVDSVSGNTFATINPHDESVITHVAEGDKADVDLAVAAAKQAFHRSSKWRRMNASARGKLLHKLADLIERDSTSLSALECLDSGKIIAAALSDTQWSADRIRYYAGMADKIHGNTIPADGEFLTISYTMKEPVGVCAQIVPWNFPIPIFVSKVAPALAAGCTVIVKPAEQTPLSALAIAALIKEAGFPPGVVNVIPGYGPTAGAALTHHPDVDKISFTGSTEVGRQILSAAFAVNLKRVTLELGGKSPLVIFNDADVDEAAQIACDSIFMHSGQFSVAASRTYVQSGIYDEFVEKAAELAKARKIGNPFDDNDQGPLIDSKLFHKVMGYIEAGKQEGARCVAGGERFGNTGFYIQPTVFADVTDDMKISREEIFGPVQSIHKFETFDEVIDRANDTNYGLGAGVITNDMTTAFLFAKHVRAGNVWVNCYDVCSPQIPCGGFKESGFTQESGYGGIMNYLETKSVNIDMFDRVADVICGTSDDDTCSKNSTE